ncbi:MAG: hypothetical protein C4560_05830 [Nitrospiraceae bacterium]|nr:MAG: hypothetical protein C4560_05830 [Nitrospiraceae bacterium]
MKKHKIFPAIFVIGVVSLCGIQIIQENVSFSPVVVYAQDAWRNEFDDICSRTQEAMLITEDELRTLVERCDKLNPLIQQLSETQKKIYSKRLQMCKELFTFMLESKHTK